MSDDQLVSIAEAARRLGLNRSTLTRQVHRGLLRSHAGRVRFSEILEDRKSRIATRACRSEQIFSSLEGVFRQASGQASAIVPRLDFRAVLRSLPSAVDRGLSYEEWQEELREYSKAKRG